MSTETDKPKRVVPWDKVVKAIVVTSLLTIVASIIVWIWVGEVRTSCHESWEDDGMWGTKYIDHWHCTAGSPDDAKFWNTAYDIMWKLDVTMVITTIIFTIAYFLVPRHRY